MTTAKPNHLAARALLLQHLDLHPGKIVSADLDPLEAGIVGDTDHADGGDSYHLGKDQIRARAGRARYSVDESPRDKRGLDKHASGFDLGYFRVTTQLGTFDLYDYNAWLVNLCRSGDPDTVDLREVIYSPDGRTVHRWDDVSVRSTGDDSHLTHTHHSEYRDADGSRMLRLATRWLRHIGLLAGEDDDMLSDTDIARIAEAVWKRPHGTSVTENRWPGAGRKPMESFVVLAATGAKDAGKAIVELAAKDQFDEVALAEALVPLLTGTQLESVIRRGMTTEDRLALAASLAA